jgi:predicted aspartyl protease
MIQGSFVQNIPLIPVKIGWDVSVQNINLILDTGFTGDLQVTPKIAQQLGLKIVGATPIQLASGTIVSTSFAIAYTSMEGKTNLVQVLISNGMPLAGISFLSKFGYKAIVDCKLKTVELHN